MRGTPQTESPVRLNVARVHVPLSAILAAWVLHQVTESLDTQLVTHLVSAAEPDCRPMLSRGAFVLVSGWVRGGPKRT